MKIIIYLMIITSILTSCQDGYQLINNEWYYIVYDEGAGIRKTKLYVHKPTFEVLENTKYAKDKDSVYFRGNTIEFADSKTFNVSKNSNYSKDKKNVYIFWDIIPEADVSTFEILEFPYAKDERRLYCGNLSINFNKINSFDLLENNGYSTFDSSIFKIEYPTLYNNIELKSKYIIYSNAIALINGRKYRGLERIK